ncbi:hypothetical protein LQZ18_11025 [Lachnospiraceae bacterium ZAX-1]
MSRIIELIDNTVAWIAQTREVGADILSAISKYAVIMPDTASKRIIYRDTDSLLDPRTTYKTMQNLLSGLGDEKCLLEFCAGNAYGMATANTLAAMKAGVCRVHTSVGGIVPGGGAAMEEVLMCAKRFLHSANEKDTATLANDCAAVLAVMGLEVSLNKAIIGGDIFAHESGMHVDGMMKNPTLYEAFVPDDVGLSRRLVVGKHSGRKTVRMKLSEWGISATDDISDNLTRFAKQLAVKQRYALTDKQLMDLYDTYMAEGGGILCSS